MQKKKRKKKPNKRTKWKYESWLALCPNKKEKESWLALCPTNYTFNIFILLIFPHQLVHSLFIYFFSLLFSHPHTSSHTPRFPLFSVLNIHSSLSFYVVFLFLLLFSFVCVFFNLLVLHLI